MVNAQISAGALIKFSKTRVGCLFEGGCLFHLSIFGLKAALNDTFIKSTFVLHTSCISY